MGGKGSREELSPLPASSHGLKVGDRCQTQWTIEEGGNDCWYTGTISKVHKDGRCHIKYDDGDSWTGDARYIMRHVSGAPPACAQAVIVCAAESSVITAVTPVTAPKAQT